MENATTAGSSQSNISRLYIRKEKFDNNDNKMEFQKIPLQQVAAKRHNNKNNLCPKKKSKSQLNQYNNFTDNNDNKMKLPQSLTNENLTIRLLSRD